MQDAVVAVTVVECSMQGSALLGGINVLHSAFPTNADQEYELQGSANYSGTSEYGTRHFVHCREVVLLEYGKLYCKLSFCPLLGGSFIRVSTVVTITRK